MSRQEVDLTSTLSNAELESSIPSALMGSSLKVLARLRSDIPDEG